MRKTPGVQPRILCWFADIPPFYPCAARPATINTRSRLPCQDAVAIWSKCSPQGLKSLRENSYCVVPSGLDLREILPGTPVPGYRLSRPFGTDSVG
jgi:hypothetical protein